MGSSQAVFIVTLNDHGHPIVTAAHELIGVAMIKLSSSVPSGFFPGIPKPGEAKKLVTAGLGTEIRSANGKLIKQIGKRIPHDFRRSTVRNLERAKVSRSDAMKIVGQAFTAMPSPMKDP